MSPDDFLEQLELTVEQRRALAGLGLSNPVTLAHMIRASRSAFQEMVGGVEHADRIEEQLHALLTTDERDSLDAPRPPNFSLGARLEPPPKRKID